MEKQLHLAAQYLAAAGINFVPKKEDDSHTNLGFSTEKKSLETHSLSQKGDKLQLDYGSFGLRWNSQNHSESLPLDGTTHGTVLQWLKARSKGFLGKPYTYGFHYELPYEISDDFRFELSDVKRLTELVELRILAQKALEKALVMAELDSPIRVWPHHFDSGAYASLDANRALGFGLAIPDTMSSEHYFYISGYMGHDAIPTDGFEPLSNGEWRNKEFVGATLRAEKVDLSEVILFFKETMENYRK